MKASRTGPLDAAFPTIRARLLALLLLAAVPLFGMAASIAWQNYLIAVDRTRQEALPILAAMAERHEESLREARRVLRSVIEGLPLQADTRAACHAPLASLLQLLGTPFRNLAVLDAQGRTLCGALPLPASGPETAAAAEAAAAASRSGEFEVEPVATGDTAGPPVLWAALPTRIGGQSSGAALALLAVDWLAPVDPAVILAPGSVGWVRSADGTFIPLGPQPPSDDWLPSPQVAAAVLAQPAVARIAASRAGPPFAYVGQTLRGGWQLLVALPAAHSIAKARASLERRLTELCLLLLAGLVAMAVGAHEWVVEPTKRLSRAVGRWRDGGPFDPGPLLGAPAEATELARVFGQATTALRAHEAELRDAMLRQDLLIQEVHHRVKNNLQIVASLLNLQASRIRVPAAQAEFQAARDRIRALATLHRHLYAHGELHAINMRGFLEELCAQLLQTLGETPEGGRITLDIAATELRITPDQAVPVALIVTEAVSNAAKYAFPAGRSGHIRVRLEKAGEDVRLTIEDDGVGIPAGRADTASGIRDGIGIQLIRGFSRQLGGRLTVEQDGGTAYLVQFKLREAPSMENQPA